jgi:hypothetical protein
MFYLSHQFQKCHNYKYLGHHIEILKSIVYTLFHMPGIDTDPDWLALDRHALDADPDPAK